jgi:beta-N-acetylhexosaminidase
LGVALPAAASTLEERLGSLFFLAFDGTSLTAEMRGWIEKRGLGGIALFGKNAVSPEQLRTLTGALQHSGRHRLFIATDHEPGSFMAIRLGRQFPGQRDLVRLGGETTIRETADALAADLADWGFNMNFAPVVDVDRPGGGSAVGGRCFSDDPDTVARNGKIFADRMLARGIVPVYKHWPGHGDTKTDSHFDLPVIDKPLAALLGRELVPYRQAGGRDLPAVMTAHILFPALDRERCATLSPALIDGLLRRRLGFRGIVISDDLAMGAVSQKHRLPQACELALRAGVDMLLITRRFKKHGTPEEAHAYLLALARRDPAFARIITTAAGRIGAVKDRVFRARD